jgi:hypothetical protein
MQGELDRLSVALQMRLKMKGKIYISEKLAAP